MIFAFMSPKNLITHTSRFNPYNRIIYNHIYIANTVPMSAIAEIAHYPQLINDIIRTKQHFLKNTEEQEKASQHETHPIKTTYYETE